MNESLLNAFFDEARLLIERMSAATERLHARHDSGDVDALFQCAHTLKSSAKAMGFDRIAQIFHEMETICEHARVDDGERGYLPIFGDILSRMKEHLDRGTLGVPESDEIIWKAWKKEDEMDAVSLAIPEGLRLSGLQYDRLIGVADALVTARTRVETLGDSLVRSLERTMNDNASALEKEYQSAASLLRRTTMDLEATLRDSRMTPLSVFFDRIPRLVADLSRTLGKQVAIAIDGGKIHADRLVIQELGGALGHLVRNSVDHGIETEGNLTIKAEESHESIAITIEDSGRGIDYDRLVGAARHAGILSEHAPVTEEAKHELLFHPHLSTSAQVTETSGRGVGMFSVREYVRSVGGKVVVESPTHDGRGTRITLRLPVTLSLVRILLVRIGHGTFGIAMGSMKETVIYDKHAIEMTDGREVIRVNDRRIPLVPLIDTLDLRRGYLPKGRPMVLVAETSWGDVGFVVDSVLHEEEALVKVLPHILSSLKTYLGAATIGDGRTVLILDPAGLAMLPVPISNENASNEFAPIEKDQLMELMNMVASHAGTALARRLGKHVELSIPEYADGAVGLPEDDWGATSVGVRMTLEGAYPGRLLFEIPESLAKMITEQVLGTPAKLHDLSKEERAFFQELGGITMHAVGNMLSRISKNPVMTKASDIRVDARGALRTHFLTGHQEGEEDLVRVRLWFGLGSEIRTDNHRGTGSLTLELRRHDAKALLDASQGTMVA